MIKIKTEKAQQKFSLINTIVSSLSNLIRMPLKLTNIIEIFVRCSFLTRWYANQAGVNFGYTSFAKSGKTANNEALAF